MTVVVIPGYPYMAPHGQQASLAVPAGRQHLLVQSRPASCAVPPGYAASSLARSASVGAPPGAQQPLLFLPHQSVPRTLQHSVPVQVQQSPRILRPMVQSPRGQLLQHLPQSVQITRQASAPCLLNRMQSASAANLAAMSAIPSTARLRTIISDKAKVKAVMLLIQHLRQAAYRQLNGSFRRWEKTTAFFGWLPKSNHSNVPRREKATTWLSSRVLEEERSIAVIGQATRLLQGARLLYLWSQKRRKQVKSYAFSLLQMKFQQPAIPGNMQCVAASNRSSLTSNFQDSHHPQPMLDNPVSEETLSLWYPPIQARSSTARSSTMQLSVLPSQGPESSAPPRFSTSSVASSAMRCSTAAFSMGQCAPLMSLPPPPLEAHTFRPPPTPMSPESLRPPGAPEPEPPQEEGSTTDAESEQSTQTQPSSAWPPAQPESPGPESNDSRHGLAHRFAREEVARRATIAAQALGVKKTAGRKTVAHAFRDAARVLHPDKGGSTADFQVINEAYGVMREAHAGSA
mmetsp:Transcript_52818/g.123551  ORF Transcript_52818/g.123551 Transcript_52818/m.123551 type:complete len:515 (+) Transcript_52818:94-1638(+)